MNLTAALNSFVRVAEFGSFRRAAVALNLSTSSVSTHISALEDHLRTRLFLRSTRRVSLTLEGDRLYIFARGMLTSVQDMEASFVTDSAADGHVVIDAPAAMVRLLILPHMAEFRRLFPSVQLKFLQGDRFFGGREEDADLLIRFGPFGNSHLASVSLGLSKTICVAAPSYLAQFGTPAHPRDLEAHQCLGFIEPGHAAARPWHFAEQGMNFSMTPSHCFLSCNEADVLLEAAAHGVGIAQTVDVHAAEMVAQGRVVPVLEGYGSSPPTLAVLYRKSPKLSIAARALLEFIVSKYPKNISLRESLSVSR